MLNLPGALLRDKQFWRVWGVKLLSRSLWVSSVATILSNTGPEQWTLATEIWSISYGTRSATSLQVTKANFLCLSDRVENVSFPVILLLFCLDRDYFFFINRSGHSMRGLEQVGWPRPMACDRGWQVNGLATDVLRRDPLPLGAVLSWGFSPAAHNQWDVKSLPWQATGSLCFQPEPCALFPCPSNSEAHGRTSVASSPNAYFPDFTSPFIWEGRWAIATLCSLLFPFFLQS